jgi:hypothetical protein
VDEAELGIDQVEVQVHAFTLPADHVELMGGVVAAKFERHARLDGAQHAHQTLGDAVALRDPAGQVFLGLAGVAGGVVLEIDDRPASLVGDVMGMLAQGVGGLFGPGPELAPPASIGRPAPPQRERNG